MQKLRLKGGNCPKSEFVLLYVIAVIIRKILPVVSLYRAALLLHQLPINRFNAKLQENIMSFEYLTNIPLEKAKREYIEALKKSGFGAKSERISVTEAAVGRTHRFGQIAK